METNVRYIQATLNIPFFCSILQFLNLLSVAVMHLSSRSNDCLPELRWAAAERPSRLQALEMEYGKHPGKVCDEKGSLRSEEGLLRNRR